MYKVSFCEDTNRGEETKPRVQGEKPSHKTLALRKINWMEVAAFPQTLKGGKVLYLPKISLQVLDLYCYMFTIYIPPSGVRKKKDMNCKEIFINK